MLMTGKALYAAMSLHQNTDVMHIDLLCSRRLQRGKAFRPTCPRSEWWRTGTSRWTKHTWRWPLYRRSLRQSASRRPGTTLRRLRYQQLAWRLEIRLESCSNHSLQQHKPHVSSSKMFLVVWLANFFVQLCFLFGIVDCLRIGLFENLQTCGEGRKTKKNKLSFCISLTKITMHGAELSTLHYSRNMTFCILRFTHILLWYLYPIIACVNVHRHHKLHSGCIITYIMVRFV